MVQSGLQVRRQVTIHWNTKNQSFLDMHAYLKATGRKNNAFFLMIYDTDLMNVDPRDPNINAITKGKILRECMANFWYFIREVVRIPTQGGEVGGGVRYELNRGNLAFHFLFLNNYKINIQFLDNSFYLLHFSTKASFHLNMFFLNHSIHLICNNNSFFLLQ